MDHQEQEELKSIVKAALLDHDFIQIIISALRNSSQDVQECITLSKAAIPTNNDNPDDIKELVDQEQVSNPNGIQGLPCKSAHQPTESVAEIKSEEDKFRRAKDLESTQEAKWKRINNTKDQRSSRNKKSQISSDGNWQLSCKNLTQNSWKWTKQPYHHAVWDPGTLKMLAN